MEDSPRLSERGREILQNARNELFLSKASVWEMAIKEDLGKLKLKPTLREYLEKCVASLGLRMLNVELEHIFKLQTLPMLHRDPFDRILVAKSMAENLPL